MIVRIYEAIKVLLTALVSQGRNILLLAFFALTSLWLVNTEKATGNKFLHHSSWLEYNIDQKSGGIAGSKIDNTILKFQ